MGLLVNFVLKTNGLPTLQPGDSTPEVSISKGSTRGLTNVGPLRATGRPKCNVRINIQSSTWAMRSIIPYDLQYQKVSAAPPFGHIAIRDLLSFVCKGAMKNGALRLRCDVVAFWVDAYNRRVLVPALHGPL